MTEFGHIIESESEVVTKLPSNTIQKRPQEKHVLSKNHYAKSHTLIFSSNKMTPQMQNLTALLFARMTESDWWDSDGNECTPQYNFPCRMVAQFLNTPTKHLSSKLRTPCLNLTQTIVGIESSGDDDYWDFLPLLKRARYHKGFLTLIPNDELRKEYIFRANEKGHANIDLKVFLSLKSSRAKVLFEILSRFQNGNKLFPIKVSSLQHYFGVLGENNKVLQPTYKSPRVFITKVIQPALKDLANNEIAKEKLKILESPSGDLGYELLEGDSHNDPLIKFNYEWLTPTVVSDVDKQAAIKSITLLVNKKKQLEETGQKMPIDDLRKMKFNAELLGAFDKAAEIDVVIQEQLEEEKLKAAEVDESKDSFTEKAEILLDGLFG